MISKLLSPRLVIAYCLAFSLVVILYAISSRVIDTGIQDQPTSNTEQEELLARHTVTAPDSQKTYTVELYYSPVHDRIRVNVAAESRQLQGLHNRFSAFSPNKKISISISTEEDGSDVLTLSQSGRSVVISLEERPVSTQTMYDAVERLVRDTWETPGDYEIYLWGPAGVLTTTYVADVTYRKVQPSFPSRYLVTETGSPTLLFLSPEQHCHHTQAHR